MTMLLNHFAGVGAGRTPEYHRDDAGWPEPQSRLGSVVVKRYVMLMWRGFIAHFVIYQIYYTLMWWKAGHKPLTEALPIAAAFALSLSVPRIVFGYFPEYRHGCISFAIVAGIAAVISLPFSFFAARMMKRIQKHDNAA
ncbi:MAG: hypothetical protein P4L87_21440 [Formivibrio sp.]|nr:hypothetical protein [Formivibrio sp.]